MKSRGFFSFKGRIFSLSFFNLQKLRRKGALARYYRKPKDDARSNLGKKVDGIIRLLLVWAVSFLVLANITGQPVLALAISLPLLILQAFVLKWLREKRESQRMLQQSMWLSGQKFIDKLLKMDPEKEYKPFIRDILAGLPGFQEVRLQSEEGGPAGGKQGLDLVGTYKEKPVAVRCLLREADKKTGPGDIRSFAGALQLGGYSNGLLITSGDFDEGVLPAVREAERKNVRIKLVNRYKLMDLARQSGAGPFQSEEASQARPKSADEKKTVRDALRDLVFGSRKKARGYFIYGLFLFAGYFLLKGSTLLSMVYLFFGALNFLLAAVTLYLCQNIEEMDPLEGLER